MAIYLGNHLALQNGVSDLNWNLKANIASPAFTGTPTVPTAAVGTNTTQIASTAFVQAVVAALVDSSPETLNTLNELATALGNDPNFATTIINLLAGKSDKPVPFTLILPTAGWSGAAPFTITIPAVGVTVGQIYDIDWLRSTVAATRILEQEAWNCVTMIESAADGFLVTCDEAVPTQAVNFRAIYKCEEAV